MGLDCTMPRAGAATVCTCRHGDTHSGNCKLMVGDKCDPSRSSTSCPLNSKCDGYGNYWNCNCLEGFIPEEGGLTCVSKRHHLQTCGKGVGACTGGLACLQGVCLCEKPSEQVFDPEAGGCKSKGSCERDSECPSHSSCKPLYEGASVKRCACNDGYTNDGRSLCKAKYMTTCVNRDDCPTAKSMDCIDGVCRCSAILNQIYDPNQSACVGLLGSPCGTNNNKCIPSAFWSQSGICVYPPGAVELETGMCAKFLPFGANCTTVVRGIELIGNCDWNKGIACRNGICDGFDPSLEYIPVGTNQGTCVGKLGSLCGVKIPVGNCEKSRSDDENGLSINFQACNYYKIMCKNETSCRDVDNKLFRCSS